MSQYKLLSKLGEGGMGVVYRALQEPLGREVAVKFLGGEPSLEVLRRFRREIDVCSRLEHPNVIRIYDSGEMDDRSYFSMEYLPDAKPLCDMVVAGTGMPVDRAVDIAVQLLSALRHCHAHELIHRDVKPSNVMIAGDGRAILMDFGLARDPGATALTEAGHVVGTPRYLSPEMLKGGEADARSDVWALGAVLHEMIAGEPAFTGPSLGMIGRAIMMDDPKPLSDFHPDIPEEVLEVVAGLLTKDAEQRWTADRAIELLEVLQARLAGRTFAGEPMPLPPPIGLRTKKTVAMPGMPVAPDTPPPRRAGSLGRASGPTASGGSAGSAASGAWTSARGLTLAAGVVVLLGVAGGALVIATRKPAPPQPVASLAPAPVALRDVNVLALAAEVGVSAFTDDPAKLTVALTDPRGKRTLAGDTEPTRAHKLAVGPLVPATAYTLEISDASGAVLLSEKHTTLSAAQQATRFAKAVDELKPLATLRAMIEELYRAFRQKKPTPQQEADKKALLSRWQARMEHALRRTRVEEMANGLSAVRDETYLQLPAEEQRALLERSHEYNEMLDVARGFGVIKPRNEPELTSAHYGLVPASRLQPTIGAGLLLDQLADAFALEAKPLPGMPVLRPEEPVERLRAWSDVRIPQAAYGAMEMSGSPFYEHPVPVSTVGLPGRCEVRVAIEETAPPLGVRILIAKTPPGPKAQWRAIAWFKPFRVERHVLVHTLPDNLLAEGPIYLRAELAFNAKEAFLNAWYKQEGRLRWVMLAAEGTK